MYIYIHVYIYVYIDMYCSSPSVTSRVPWPMRSLSRSRFLFLSFFPFSRYVYMHMLTSACIAVLCPCTPLLLPFSPRTATHS